jgi:hypothetical protein
MKKIQVIFFVLCCSLFAQAQLAVTFSKDKERFVKELSSFMTANKMEQTVNTANEFEKMVKDGKIPSTWFEHMAVTCNEMSGRQMSAYTHYNPYLQNVMYAAKTGLADAKFIEWSDFVDEITYNQKKGDNTGFLKLMDFSEALFLHGALSMTQAKTWRVDTKEFKMDYNNGRPRVIFPVTTLTGAARGDSIKIFQTAGEYYPLETRWEGKSGKVDWKRGDLDPAKVYCTFKSYAVNVSNFNYTVDTVTFYHADYFKAPVMGKLLDKMVSGADSGNISYPRFESFEQNIAVKDIAPNVTYYGGFSMNGGKVLGYGSGEEKARLDFFARDGKTKVLSAKSYSISMKKGEELGADKSEVAIYFGTDSIYHPQLNVVYKIQKREIRLLRGETGMGKAKFADSYHNHEFQTDAIFWNLDSSVLNLKILQGAGQKPGVFESVNYFQKDLIRKIQGFGSYEPLSILKKLYEKNGSREINATEVARAFDPKLTESEARSIFYELVENGFILYNEVTGVVTVRDKTLNYVLANAKKIDYDVIKIKSAPKSGNDYIDLKSSNIDLKGTFEIPISDTAYVYFRPKEGAISLQKDRNMEFDGLVYAGRMDLYGKKFKFQYAPFTTDLTQVDTMRINVQDSNKVDSYGEPVLIPLKSKIENMKGLLEIDAPINKSGRTKLPQFPRLYSREKAYIYYDDPSVAKGSYNRKDFFFELDPFRLDSLNNFSGDIINLKGKLASGGIFQDIRDSVKIQKDGSLGFKSETPKDGYDLYKGKGKYYGKFELNYNGLQGDGRVTHSTSDFETHDVKLYPDSLIANTDSFSIAKTFEGVKTPAVKGFNEHIRWRPKADSMEIIPNKKEEAFSMYDDGFTTFKGNLLLTGKGLRGNGLLDWDEATLESRDFSFQTMNLSADTSALNIKSTGDKVTFKTPNVNAKVDFKTRIGDFVSNQKGIPTDFSYNQYNTAINEFKWFMDEKILDFKAPPQGPGEYFTSTRPDQKGLRFLGKRATYSLITSILRIEQVPEIRIADAAVVPDSGVVIIEEGAKMRQLRNAVIKADTLKNYHRIDGATVDVYSKQELKAVGNYHYTTKGVKEVINFTDIGCKKFPVGKGKNKTESWLLYANADLDESKKFQIYPDVYFQGAVALKSLNPLLNFDGFAKLDLKNPAVATSNFNIKQDVDPAKLELKFDTIKSSDGNQLAVGIHINPTEGIANMYSTIINPLQEATDVTLFKAKGIVTQDANGVYLFGSEKKIKENAVAGNLLKYDDKKGTIKAEGRFRLGTNFGIIKSMTVGSADVKLDSSIYKYNFTFGLDVKMDPKVQERLEFYMAGDNIDLNDIGYENDKQKKAIYELSDEKKDKKLLEEFDKNPVFNKRPENLFHNLVFSDINFIYDSTDVSLRSVGKIGLAMVGKKVINKKLEGYIEFQYKGGADLFTIYLKTGTNDWVFFEYRPGTLGILSSYDDINTMIGSTPPEKRRIKGDNDRFYLYTLGSSLNKADFVDYMKDRANGVIRPRFEPKLDIPIPGDSAFIEGDSSFLPPSMMVDSFFDAPLPPDVKEQMERQEEIDGIEQMRQSGQQILSGPPPGRDKPKEEPAAEPAPDATPVPQNDNPAPQEETPAAEPPKLN